MSFGFDCISGGGRRNQNGSMEGTNRAGKDARSVTRCHHVAFSGSSWPQVIFEPYAARVLYSYTYVGPNMVCPSSPGYEFTSLRHLYHVPVIFVHSASKVSTQLTCVHQGFRKSVKQASQQVNARVYCEIKTYGRVNFVHAKT
jgi:hypothetical protein